MNTPQKTDFSPNILERFFHLQRLNTNFKVELLAGITTFLTMSYIIFVNPLFLSFFGDPNLKNLALPFSASMTATCLASALMCIFMGLWTNYPFALAPGMGLNAVVSYQMVLSLGLSWPQAMGVIVLEGIAITILVISGLREAVVNSIPMSLKQAISIGIGLFLAFIGLQNAGFVKAHPATLVTLGDFTRWPIMVSVFGILVTAILMKRKVRGALLLGIIFSTVLAVILNYITGLSAFPELGKAVIPESDFSAPDLSTFRKFDFTATVMVGIFFILAIFFARVADMVQKEATAPALIVVGFLMLTIIKEIPFERFEESFPAFLIMIVMPLTYSISNGIGFGFIVYTLIMLLSGKGKQVHLLMYLASTAFILDFLLPVFKIVFKF